MGTWVDASQLTAMLLSGPEGTGHDSEIIENGDFRIDLGARRASVRGQELRLSNEEFELLVFLIGHPTSIITPNTQLRTRWGHNLVRRADILHVLTELRKKLEGAGCAHYLRTEPWIVARFDPHSHREIR